jgi:hypothetical protein
VNYICRCCRGDRDPRSGRKYTLPNGWQAFKLTNGHWRIRKILSKADSDRSKAEENLTVSEMFMNHLKSQQQIRILEEKLPLLPEWLISQLLKCKSRAQLLNRTHKVELIFRSDGEISAELLEPKGPLPGNDLMGLFSLVWKLVINGCNARKALDLLKNHPNFSDIETQCLNCGKCRITRSFYCSRYCQQKLSEFCAAQRSKPKYRIEQSISRRLIKVLSNIRQSSHS